MQPRSRFAHPPPPARQRAQATASALETPWTLGFHVLEGVLQRAPPYFSFRKRPGNRFTWTGRMPKAARNAFPARFGPSIPPGQPLRPHFRYLKRLVYALRLLFSFLK